MSRHFFGALLGLALLSPARIPHSAVGPAAARLDEVNAVDSADTSLAALRERMIDRADSALLTLPAGNSPQFRSTAFRGRVLRTYRKIDDATVRLIEESLDRVDSARTTVEWRRMSATDSAVRAHRAMQPRKAKPERRRKGGGDLYEQNLGEPKTPPVREHTESPLTDMPDGPKGSTRTGKMVRDISYANWELSIEGSVEVGTSQEQADRSWNIAQVTRTKSRMGVCPDPSGVVRGTFEYTPMAHTFQISDSAAGKAVGVSTLVIAGTFAGRVNDAAELVDYDVDAVVEVKVEMTEHGAGKDPIIKPISWGRGSANQTGIPWSGSSGDQGTGPFKFSTDPDRTGAEGKNSLDGIVLVSALRTAAALVVDPVLSQASSMWKDGECLKLTVDPQGPLVLPSRAPVHLEVTRLEHRQTDERLGFPITVRGGSVENLTPEQGKAPFGVDFRLQSRAEAATSYVGGGGVVTFEVLSRRGRVQQSVSVEPDDMDAGYLITYRTLNRSEKEGIARDVAYRAVVRQLPKPDDEGNNFGGQGAYQVMAVERKANCLNDFPEDYERIRGMGRVKATATVTPGDNTTTIVFALEPLDGPRAYMFTKSFRFMDKQMQLEAGRTDADQPLIAGAAVGVVQLEGDSTRQAHESVAGESVCRGKVTDAITLDVVRLK
jgi:hypothetical protein